jgi:phage-related protein
MSTSIYSISVYTPSTTYQLNDVASYSGSWNSLTVSGYLYCIVAGLGSSSTPSSTQWDGFVTHNNEVKTKFIWTPSYGAPTNQNPKVLSVRFGDGYESRISDGINNDLIKLDLVFENRGINETTAILHFLTQRNGRESFVFTPQPPYTSTKKFICRDWRNAQNFYGNYTINANFEEVVN